MTVMRSLPTTMPYWRLVAQPGAITQEILDYPWPGSGTEADPYLVFWIPGDFRNPQNWTLKRKMFICILAAWECLVVALVSSAYTGGMLEIEKQMGVGNEVATLGVALYVLGFGVGPLLWAPLSETYGRQKVFFGTFLGLVVFAAGSTGAKNIQTLIIFRFLTGSFGGSPFTNSGSVIADMFLPQYLGLALTGFVAAPFLGPVLGPIIGGFLGMNKGWKWVMGFLGIICGAAWIAGTLLKPETYAPVLLRRRAETLTRLTGKQYRSRHDITFGVTHIGDALKKALSRPFVLLFFEPIVFLLSLYLAIVYATLYMLFEAFPIVYVVHRHWNQGVGGLAFLGVLVGLNAGIVYSVWDNVTRYRRVTVSATREHTLPPPEARLPPAMIAAVAIPVGLFWFAWTNSPSVHWMASIAAGVPFGFGMMLVFLSVLTYLIDTYSLYSAGVLAANGVLRFGLSCAFPLFTTYMFQNLGLHWGASIPAFLSVACMPFPFIFYRYGPAIRTRCKYSAISIRFVARLLEERKAQALAEAGLDASAPEQQQQQQHQGSGQGREQGQGVLQQQGKKSVPEDPGYLLRETERSATGTGSSLTEQEAGKAESQSEKELEANAEGHSVDGNPEKQA